MSEPRELRERDYFHARVGQQEQRERERERETLDDATSAAHAHDLEWQT